MFPLPGGSRKHSFQPVCAGGRGLGPTPVAFHPEQMIYLMRLLNWEVFQAHLGLGAFSHPSSEDVALAHPRCGGGEGPLALSFDKTPLPGDGEPR